MKKMSDALKSYYPFGLYLLIPFAALFPSIFLGRFYFEGDLLIYHGIFFQWLKTALFQGQFPLWNPYIFGGQPFFANPNSMMAYPFLYLFVWFTTAKAITFFYFLHLGLAGAGMHFWLRNLGLSRESCWTGGFSFALSGFFWVEIIHLSCLAAFAWIPWFIGLLELTSKSLKPFPAFCSGLAFAFLFLTGFFQLILGTFYFGSVYFLFRVFTNQPWVQSSFHFLSSQEKWKKSLFSFFCFGWACLPSLVLLIPALEFVGFSDRLQGNLSYDSFNGKPALNPGALYQFLFPTNSNITHLESLHDLDSLAKSGYLGIFAPFLILFAFKRNEKKLPFFFFATAALGLLICLGYHLPLHQWFCRWIPGFKLLRSPHRFLYIYTASVSVLIALGFETIFQKNKTFDKKIVLDWLLIYSLFILFLTTFFFNKDRIQMVLLASGGLGIFLYFQKKSGAKYGKALLLASIFFSLLLGGWSSASSGLGPASNFDFGKESSILERVKKEVGYSRVFIGDNILYTVEKDHQIFPTEFPTNAACLYSVRNIGGYDPLSLKRRGNLHWLAFSTFNHLWAIQGFVTGNEKGKVPGFTRNAWGQVRFYVAKEKTRFVYAPYQFEYIPNDDERLRAMSRSDFNPYAKTYLERPLSPSVLSQWPHQPAKLDYVLTEDRFNEQVFKLNLDRASWVVFSEVNYPGWKAWVDQTPIEIFTSNYLFRGLFIPSGEHQIHFRFQPFWFSPLLLGTGTWILLTLAGAWFGMVGKKP